MEAMITYLRELFDFPNGHCKKCNHPVKVCQNCRKECQKIIQVFVYREERRSTGEIWCSECACEAIRTREIDSLSLAYVPSWQR